MNNILRLAALLVCLLPGQAAVVNGSAVVSGVQSLASISGLSGQVKRFRIQVIPGYSGKIFVGNSASMSTATYANVMRVLYPNSAGGWSEKYEVSDPSSRDGIPLSQIHVTGAIPGERFLWEVEQVGGVAVNPLEPFYAGPLAPSAPGAAACWHSMYPSNRMMSGYEVSVVPGMSGKIRVGRQLDSYSQPDALLRGVGRILWPNTGAANNDSNHSESLSVFTSARFSSSNPIYGHSLCVYPEVYGEFPLVVSWQRTPYAEAWDGSFPAYDISQGAITLTGSTQVVPVGSSYGSRMRLWATPGSTGKVYVGLPGLNKATLANVFKVVSPNPSGGHSDGYDLEYPTRALGLSTVYGPVSISGDVAGEVVTQIIEIDRLDPAGWSRQWTGASHTALLSSAPTRLLTSTDWVSKITVRNIPGQCSKIYIGSSAMNTTTLAGVAKVLYPNCYGGIGEEYEIGLPGGNSRNLDQRDYFFASDYPVDVLLEIHAEATDHHVVVPPKYTIKSAGAACGGGTPAALTLGITDLRLQISSIPGYSGKFRVGNAAFAAASQPDSSFAGVHSLLFPNTGTLAYSNARSEGVAFSKAYGGASVNWWIWPEVFGECSSFATWGY